MTKKLKSGSRPAARQPLRHSLRLASDIGGTFTDVAAFDARSRKLLLGKTLSTPAHLVEGINTGVAEAGADVAQASLFLHGSTIAINTMLERTGARTALITTEGFRDVYEIGRINRPDAYNLYFQKHDPLVRRSLRFEVRERMTAEGDVHVALDEAGVREICAKLRGLDIEAVAIMFLHSYRNPAHERRVKEIVSEELPGVFVSASHELSQEYREFERCSTVVANAFVGPRVRDYIAEIDDHLAKSQFDGAFMLVHSTGGLYESAQAKEQCIRMLESGPAAGVIGAQALCAGMGEQEAIAFDMGGTTAKAGVIYKGQALNNSVALIGGYERALPVQISMIDIFEVGTGGGSIAWLDEGMALHVGPRSAGAEPGPACYGRGGEQPTVTDANLVLGRLAPDRFLGGSMKLDVQAARAAIASKIAEPLGLDVIQAAKGILRIAATAMSWAVKTVTTERGLDAASFPLIAYGGAGPLHASSIAREIGMARVIVPRAPGHFCAFGMLFSDLRYDYVRTWPARLANLSFESMGEVYDNVIAQGREALERGGAGDLKVNVVRWADMRYVGQEHAVTIELPPTLLRKQDRVGVKERFDAEHQLRYGTCAPKEAAEIVSLRVTVSGVMKKPPLEEITRGTRNPPAAANSGARPVHYDGRKASMRTPVYARDLLRAGNKIAGPALVEEHASTTVVFPGDTLTVDKFGNLVIEIGNSLNKIGRNR